MAIIAGRTSVLDKICLTKYFCCCYKLEVKIEQFDFTQFQMALGPIIITCSAIGGHSSVIRPYIIVGLYGYGSFFPENRTSSAPLHLFVINNFASVEHTSVPGVKANLIKYAVITTGPAIFQVLRPPPPPPPPRNPMWV